MNDKPEKDPKGDYAVGFQKPPLATRFAKGRSGNPKGRPKGRKNLKTDVLTTLSLPVPITEDGRKRKVSTQEAVLLRLREKALKGDAKAIDRLVSLAQIHNNEDLVGHADEALSKTDAAIIESFIVRRGATVPASKATPEREERDAAVSTARDYQAEDHAREREIEEAWKRSGLADDSAESSLEDEDEEDFLK